MNLRPLLRAASPLALTLAFAAPTTARAADEPAAAPKVSLALERVGGVSYTKTYAKDSDGSASLTALGLGGPTINPYAAPRIGVDYLMEGGLTLGAGLSIARYSLSASNTTATSTTSESLGSLFIYTLTPRVGYRIPVSPSVDFTPRAGITLAGGSVSSGRNNDSAGVFALALSGEGVLAYRATRSFNLLAGAGIDYTVTASASQSGGNGSSTSTDVKGGLYALQLWLGVGGYL